MRRSIPLWVLIASCAPDSPRYATSEQSLMTMPPAQLNIFGQGQTLSPATVTGTPPDVSGAAGRSHYVQAVNGGYMVWNKDGGVAQASQLTNTIWAGYTGTNAGNGCATRNDGTPSVLYDQLADRWLCRRRPCRAVGRLGADAPAAGR